MKRFVLIMFPIVSLAVFTCVGLNSNSLIGLVGGDNYVQKYSGDIVYASNDLGYILEQNSYKNCINYIKGNSVVGECVLLSCGEEKINYICDKLGLLIFKTYKVEKKLMIEGFSAKLRYGINGKRENVQICVDGGETIIASPIIYGSF